jgi:hypothetical protein
MAKNTTKKNEAKLRLYLAKIAHDSKANNSKTERPGSKPQANQSLLLRRSG